MQEFFSGVNTNVRVIVTCVLYDKFGNYSVYSRHLWENLSAKQNISLKDRGRNLEMFIIPRNASDL